SMGAVMDKGIGPAFDATHATQFRGIGRGSYGLAHLLASGEMRADVFVAVTSGPMAILQKAGLATRAVPVASTQIVVTYNPKSRFAADFKAAAQGAKPWYAVLEQPGVHFGRTDPAVDPEGRNVLMTLQLAALYYHQPKLMERIAGPIENSRQIFTEESILSRLEAGQLDASMGYESTVVSRHLPFIALPAEINLGNPAMQAKWYARAGFKLRTGTGKTIDVKVQPLVFYAAVLKGAAHPALARQFVAFLESAAGQKLLAQYGYSAPH
ncbi:MAG TPA: extracellular solute-binding protein, partial [Nevskiaceae bacterium]|nr:extracellular solute-binding protein [Nevskiaceae bacterium]